jgi:hypothetical protein
VKFLQIYTKFWKYDAFLELFKLVKKRKRKTLLLGRFLAQGHHNWARQRPIGPCDLLGPFGNRGGAEPAMVELAQVVAACSRRRCRRVGTTPRLETRGVQGEVLSGSLGGRTSPKSGPPWRRKLGRREEWRWRGLVVGVVGSELEKRCLVAGLPWAVTARLVRGRGGGRWWRVGGG